MIRPDSSFLERLILGLCQKISSYSFSIISSLDNLSCNFQETRKRVFSKTAGNLHTNQAYLSSFVFPYPKPTNFPTK
jgi:hypothetical protein